MRTPTPRALLLAGGTLPVAALPVLFPSFGSVVWTGVLAGIAVLAGVDLLTLRSSKLSVRVDVPDRLPLGRTGIARVTVDHRLHAGVRETVHLEAGSEVAVIDGEPVPIGPDEDVRLRLEGRRRGPVTLEARFVRMGPLGLVRQVLRAPEAAALAVVLDRVGIRERALAATPGLGSRSGPRLERFVGEGSEFVALREWTPGLDTKHIDWKATARLGVPLWREHQVARDQLVVLAIDLGPAMAGTVAGRSRLDHAIESALALALAALRAGDRVVLCGMGGGIERAVGPFAGARRWMDLCSAAGALHVRDHVPHLPRAFSELSRLVPRRAFVVFFTEPLGGGVHEMAWPALRAFAKHHAVLHLSFEEPMLRELTEAPPVDLPTLQRAAVARRLIARRRLFARRLQDEGVSCLEVPPARAVRPLVDHWILTKRRRGIA